MAEIRLRPFEPADSPALSAWYDSDPQGLEAMMGTPLPELLHKGCLSSPVVGF